MHHIKCFMPMVVVIALGLGYSADQRAWAQEPAVSPRVDVPLGSTIPLQMTGKQFIKSARSENPAIANVTIKLDDPRTVLIKGEKAGFTRIALTDKDDKSENYEVYVGKTGDQLREEFLALARRAVPTAIVDVIPSGATVILTGTVAHASSVQIIMEIARGLFAGANIINGMRVGGVQMVQLDVIVAAVNRTKTRDMSFNFIESGTNHFISSVLNTGNTPGVATLGAATLTQGILSAGGNLTGAASAIFGIGNGKQAFVGFLNALKQENLVKIMAMPTVVTLSGRPANLVDGGQVPTVASSVGGANVSYLPFGTQVSFLPIVLGNGKIHLEVQATISDVNKSLSLSIGGTSPVSAPGFNSRSVSDATMIEDGQTLAIGGLIQNKNNGSTAKFPVLGDLPFIGAAFRSVSYTDDEEELLILITPRLVDPMACNQLPKLLPGQETRNPDDFELFLEGILEAPRGQRTVSMRNYVPAYKYSPSNELFPANNGPGIPPAMNFGNYPPASSTGSTPPRASATPETAPRSLPNQVSGPQLAQPVSAQEGQEIPTTMEVIQVPEPLPSDTPATTVPMEGEGPR